MNLPLLVLLVGGIAAGSIAIAWRLDARLSFITSIGAALGVMAANAHLYLRYYSDDGFITLRYARNLADGLGPVWNPGERVEGYTNFLWMILLAGAHRLGADLFASSIWLAYVAFGLTFVVLWRLQALWGREEGGLVAHPVVLSTALLLVSANDSLVYWGFSGLETALAACTLTLTVFLRIRESRAGGIPWSALAAAAATMTRPEMLVVAGVTWGFGALDAVRTRDRDLVRHAAAWAALFAVAFGAYFVWRFSYYGYPLPNTFYAKVGSSFEFARRGVGYVHGIGTPQLLLLFLAGGASLFAAATEAIRKDAAYVFAVVAAWVAAVIVEGGDAFTHARFLAPLVPIVYFSGVCGAAVLMQRAAISPRRAAAIGLAVSAVITLSLLQSATDPTISVERERLSARQELGRWLHANVPADYTVATFASGAVPYYAQTRALDLLGLTDETIAHSEVSDFGKGIPGHEKYNVDYVLETARPEIIVLGDADDGVLLRADLQGSPDNNPPRDRLYQDDRLWDSYEPAAVRLELGWFNMLIRNEVVDAISVDWTESRGPVRPGISEPPQ